MKLNNHRILTPMFVLILLAVSATAAVLPGDGGEKSAGDVVAELYDIVTFKADDLPDWQRAKSLFIAEAVIVLRTGKEETTVFSVDDWVQDFIDFIEKAKIADVGFTEKIIRTKSMVMGDMAQILVLYESSVPGSARGPRPGVDHFSLVKKDGQWKIIAITNEIPNANRPIPAELQE